MKNESAGRHRRKEVTDIHKANPLLIVEAHIMHLPYSLRNINTSVYHTTEIGKHTELEIVKTYRIM